MLFFYSLLQCSSLNVNKTQILLSLFLCLPSISFLMDQLGAGNHRIILNKKTRHLFLLAEIKDREDVLGEASVEFVTVLSLIGNLPTIWVQIECHYRDPVGPQITYCAYQCNQDQVIV